MQRQDAPEGPSAPPPPEGSVPVRSRRRFLLPGAWRADLLSVSLTVLLTSVLAFVTTGMRPRGLRRPASDGDLFFYYGTIRGLLDNGWYLENDALGHPYGQDLARFPILDQTHFALLKVLGLGSDDPILVTNAYLLLGYPLAALFGYLFLRVVGVRPWLSAPLALSYAILPWHADRVAHLFLISYWVVPLGMTLVYLVASGRLDTWLPTLSTRQRRLAVTGLCLAAVAVALGGVYYALMLVALMLLAVLMRGWRSGAWRSPSMWPAGFLVGTTFVSLAISRLALSLATGPDDAGDGFVRRAGPGETLGGKVTHVLLPWEGSPFGGSLRESYDESALIALPERTKHGIIAVVGLWLVLIVAARLLMSRWRPREDRGFAALPWLVGTTLLLVLTYATTGFGALATTLLPEIRGWNRYSVFLALTSTAVLGLLVQRGLARIRWQPALVMTAAVVALFGVVAADSGQEVRDLSSDRQARKISSSRAATAAVDRAVLPTTCPAAQWPHRPHPEPLPSGRQPVYSELIPYLSGWDRPMSFGGVKGGLAGDWPGLLDQSSAQNLTLQLSSAGFCVLEVLGPALATSEQRELSQDLTSVLGPPVAQDTVNGRTYYDLRAARGRLDQVRDAQGQGAVDLIRDATLRPVQAVVDQESSMLQRNPGSAGLTQVIERESSLRVRNTSDRPRAVTMRVPVQVPEAGERTEQVVLGDQAVRVGGRKEELVFTFELAPHTTRTFDLSVTGPGTQANGRRIYLLVDDPVLEYDRGLPTG